MLKRVTWFSMGLVTGMGASKWLEVKAKRRLARYLPAAQLEAGLDAADRAREAAADKVADLRHALEEGRDAMAAKEAALRRQLQLGSSPEDEYEPAAVRRSGRVPQHRSR